MAISIDWNTFTILVPQADTTLVSGTLYELDVDAFRLALKDLEDNEAGMTFPKTHNHNTEVTLSGVTYARFIEILSPYRVEFEATGAQWTCRLSGGNTNIADVKVANHVSLIVGNSAGLIVTSSGGGSGASAADVWQYAIENSLTAEQLLRILVAGISGKSVGVGTIQEKYKSVTGSKDRITVDFDAQGNRDSVTLDGT